MAHPLDRIARELPGQSGASWRKIPMSCHVATLIWLHEAQFGILPNGPADIPKLLDFNAIITRIVAAGTAVTRQYGQVVEFKPGSVVVFHRNRDMGHSCVADSHTVLVGYNQTDWFSSPGVANRFSVHFTSDIKWRGAGPSTEAEAKTGHFYSLSVTPGPTAIDIYNRF